MATERGRLLLLLASGGPQNAAALARGARAAPAETLRRLQHLVNRGLVIADTGVAVAVYRLVRSADPLTAPTAPSRVLVVDGDAVTRELAVDILEDEAYVVAALERPTTAQLLLEHLQFGLVITDSFGRVPAAALIEPAAVVAAAGATPVVLFTAHPVDLDAARAAGFHAVLAKPFERETFIATVRDLLPPGVGQPVMRKSPAYSIRTASEGASPSTEGRRPRLPSATAAWASPRRTGHRRATGARYPTGSRIYDASR